MSLDPRYVVGININDYFVDKTTGLPLSGGTISFFKDQDRSQAKLVYQLSGSPPNYTYTPLSDPLTLSAVGTVVNTDIPAKNVAIYYYPYDSLGNIELYYIVVEDSNGVIQLEREAWPNTTGQSTPTGSEGAVMNQLQNPQFVDVLFNYTVGLTITIPSTVTNAVYEIAPNWNLNVSTNGAATIIINRTALAGSENIETNPPFELDILPEGANITTLNLVQRLNNNPDIWANGYIAGSCIAASLDGIAHTISMVYSPSVTAAATTIFSEATAASGYTQLFGTVELLAGDNTDNGNVGYVDIIYVLPTVGSVAITSTQVLGLETNIDNVGYDQQTANMQKSLLFEYYNPLIQAIPVPSISEGWDFKVNPAQFGSTFSPTTFASVYMWDQTIVWQNNNNLVSGSRDAAGRLAVNISSGGGQFALIQYLSVQQMQILLANGWSTLINAYTDNPSGAPGTVSFYYTTDGSLPNLASSHFSLISTMDANGKPSTFHGNWTELPNPLLGENRFTIPYNAANTTSSIALNGWAQPAYGISSTATYVAIVVGFSGLSSTNVYFDSIAVTPGRLAVPFAPVDSLLTLKQMQRYYEKSYPSGYAPGTAGVLDGSVFLSAAVSAGGGILLGGASFINLTYTQKLTASPAVNLYSYLTGVPGSLEFVWYKSGVFVAQTQFASTAFNILIVGSVSTALIPNGTAISIAGSGPVDEGLQIFQYTVDGRYGLF